MTTPTPLPLSPTSVQAPDLSLPITSATTIVDSDRYSQTTATTATTASLDRQSDMSDSTSNSRYDGDDYDGSTTDYGSSLDRSLERNNDDPRAEPPSRMGLLRDGETDYLQAPAPLMPPPQLLVVSPGLPPLPPGFAGIPVSPLAPTLMSLPLSPGLPPIPSTYVAPTALAARPPLMMDLVAPPPSAFISTYTSTDPTPDHKRVSSYAAPPPPLPPRARRTTTVSTACSVQFLPPRPYSDDTAYDATSSESSSLPRSVSPTLSATTRSSGTSWSSCPTCAARSEFGGTLGGDSDTLVGSTRKNSLLGKDSMSRHHSHLGPKRFEAHKPKPFLSRSCRGRCFPYCGPTRASCCTVLFCLTLAVLVALTGSVAFYKISGNSNQLSSLLEGQIEYTAMETGSQDLSDLGRAGGQLRVIAFSGVTGRVYVTAAANASSIMTYTVSLSVLVGRTNGAPHSAVELRPPAAQPVLSLTQRLDGDSDDRRRINSTTSHAVNQGSWTLWPLGADAQAIAALNASQIPVVSVQLTVPALALMARNISLLIDAPDMDVVLDGDASHVYHSLSVATRETVRAYGGTVYSTSGSTMSPPLFVRRSLDVQILPPTEANNSTSSSPYLSPLVELPKVAFVDAGASANITVAAVGALDVGMVPPMDGRSSFDAYLSGPMVRLRLPTDANLRWTATMDDRRLVMPAAVNYTIPPPTGINGSLAEGFVGAVPEDSRSNGTRVVTVEGKGTFSLSWMKD